MMTGLKLDDGVDDDRGDDVHDGDDEDHYAHDGDDDEIADRDDDGLVHRQKPSQTTTNNSC